MYQKKIDSIKESALHTVSAFPEQIHFRDFLRSDIHPAIKKYVVADLRLRIYNERRFLYENSRFNYDDSVVKILLNKIDARLEESYVFQKETLQRSVNLGIYFNASYIIRPVKTIQRMIFSTQAERSINEVEYWLEHVYYYSFIIKALLNKLKEGNQKKADTHTFENAALTVLSELNGAHAEQFVAESIDSIYDFTGETDTEIEITLFKTLLEECGLKEYLAVVNNLPFTYFNKVFGKDELKKLIMGSQEQATMPAPEFHSDLFSVPEPEKITAASLFGETAKTETEVPSEPEVKAEIREEEKTEAQSTEPVVDEPSDKKEDSFLTGLYNKKKVQFEEVKPEKEATDSVTPDDSHEEIPSLFSGSRIQPEEYDENESFRGESEDRMSEQAEPQSEKSVRSKDIFSYFTEDEALKIIDVVFSGDNSDFFDTVNRIEARQTYQEAEEIAGLAIKRAGISESNKTARMFYSKLKKFFEEN